MAKKQKSKMTFTASSGVVLTLQPLDYSVLQTFLTKVSTAIGNGSSLELDAEHLLTEAQNPQDLLMNSQALIRYAFGWGVANDFDPSEVLELAGLMGIDPKTQPKTVKSLWVSQVALGGDLEESARLLSSLLKLTASTLDKGTITKKTKDLTDQDLTTLREILESHQKNS